MSSALDRFERSLVAASRALSAQGAPASTQGVPAIGPTGARAPRFRRLRSLGRAVQVTLVLGAFCGLAGGAAAAYLLLGDGVTRTLPSFECDLPGNSGAIIPAVTGSPLVDCANAWPSATGGRHAAPHLAIWGPTNGRLAAIARPASWGPPARSGWRRLPTSWTVDLQTVELSDQLGNISEPFTSLTSQSCSYLSADVAAVRSLLRIDGLPSWRVSVQGQAGQLSNGCRSTVASVNGQAKAIELIQSPAQSRSPSGSAAAVPPTITRHVTLAHQQLKRLYAAVNRELAGRCESVPAAAALWTRRARAAGFSPATLAVWREANARKPNPATFFKHYTLYTQPAQQRTGTCAHVLVMEVPGSGVANVYAARIVP